MSTGHLLLLAAVVCFAGDFAAPSRIKLFSLGWAFAVGSLVV